MSRPLDSIRVLDISQGAGGPYAAGILEKHGASVIKVEPTDGEWGRYLGPPFVGDMAAGLAGINAGKRSIAIDVRAPQGRDVILQLLQHVDVLVESFRPGVMERLGLGWDELSAQFPSLIYCSLTAFGPTGPLSRRPGVDGAIQAMGGLMSIIGQPGTPPAKVGAPAADMLAGMQLAQGATLALLGRAQTGLGSHVEVSLLDSLLEFQQIPFNMHMADSSIPARSGSGAPYSTPNEMYGTQDGHILVAAYTPQRWENFCSAIGLAEITDDPKFITNGDRLRNRQELSDLIESVLTGQNTSHWIKVLQDADVICAPLLDYPAILREGLADGMLRNPGNGSCVVGVALSSSAYPIAEVKQSPRLAGHTREVLTELGLDDSDIQRLIENQIVLAEDGADCLERKEHD